MIRQIVFTFVVVFLASRLHAYSSGPDPRLTGAPGDSPLACTLCHSGRLNSGPGGVNIALPNGPTYTSGVTQHIMVQISDPSQRRWGFEMTARLASDLVNGQAGDFNPTDGFTQVECDDGRSKPCSARSPVEFITHTSAGTRIGTPGGVTFEFDWTPPASGADDVVFYVAANAANGDGGFNGDHIYTASLRISAAAAAPPPVPTVTSYLEHNLVSDVPGLADNTDLNLVDPGGIAEGANGLLLIANDRTGTSTAYNNTGQSAPAGSPLVIHAPAPANAGSPSSPTSEVLNGTSGFEIAPGMPAVLLLAAKEGTISGWNPMVDPVNAVLVVDRSGAAVYQGLALAANASGTLLYAANLEAGTIDVFDSNFQPAVVSGGFLDPNLPPGFAPFNIQAIGNRLYVTYAQTDPSMTQVAPGAGAGIVNVFDTDGNLQQRLISNGPLNAPWGVALAPASFGTYSNMLLIGNFGDGQINAFDPASGAFLGALQNPAGTVFAVPGLRGLQFGGAPDGSDANVLYFSAGISNGGNLEDHGLFGSLRAASAAQ